MSLDPRFLCSSDLEGLFVDKLTGLPLAAGIITFYSDESRTVKKAVYQLTGSPPYNSSSFTALPNPLTLSSIGSYQDSGANNIVIYYFPYVCATDGVPSTATTEQELYYVTVENSGNTQQFTREAWPPLATNLSSGGNAGDSARNYITNGQFLTHNDEPTSDTTTESGITIKNIAQGGWSFKQTTGGTGVYTLSFNAEPSNPGGNLEDFPPYSFNIASTGSGTETVRDFVVQWPDVNTFSKVLVNPAVNAFNLLFAAKLNSGASETFDIRLIQNFGTGGSTATDVSISTQAINTTYNYYNVNISIPDNSGKTIGPGNFIAIAIRMPASVAFNARFTDFAFTLGSASLTKFPVTTPDQVLSQAVAGYMPVPNPDGSDLYLPLKLTQKGLIFDNSEIGCLVTSMAANSTATPPVGTLYCDGSKYITANNDAVTGIPYSRLFNKLLANNMPIFGTGADFSQAAINSGTTSQIVLSKNAAGIEAAPANGASSPAFTYTPVFYVGSAGFGYRAGSNSSGYVVATSTFTAAASVGSVSAGTSGMTAIALKNSTLSPQIFGFYLLALSAAALGNGAGTGKYFDFPSNTTGYRMWFQTATETAPAAGGNTLIKVNLDLTMTLSDVAYVIANAIAGHQVNAINVGTAASITSGQYFTFVANAVTYNVWYKKDGAGTAPALSNLIEVGITTGQTAAQVASATQLAINSRQFAVPDLRGMFLRAADPNSTWDFDQLIRVNNSFFGSSAQVGSFEIDYFGTHTHPFTSYAAVGAGPVRVVNNITDGTGTVSEVTGASGGSETKPVNIFVNYYMKY